MRIVIVEDEVTVAHRLERLIEDILGQEITHLKVFQTLDDANDYIATQSIELLILDLNLAGRDGFELLKQVVARSFHTIVVSAYAERAIDAFEHGVLDFVAKPFSRQRLELALNRYNSSFRQQQTRYIAIRRRGVIEPIELTRIDCFQGANVYSEAHLDDGQIVLHDKSLSSLAQILPDHFERVHKSYIANLARMIAIHQTGNNAELEFRSGLRIPVSRSRIRNLKNRLI